MYEKKKKEIIRYLYNYLHKCIQTQASSEICDHDSTLPNVSHIYFMTSAVPEKSFLLSHSICSTTTAIRDI